MPLSDQPRPAPKRTYRKVKRAEDEADPGRIVDAAEYLHGSLGRPHDACR